MSLNIGILKKHPYATGGVVIVGGIVVFYLLSRGGGTTVASSGGNIAAADAALGQAQAAAAIQTNGQNAAIQQASIAAQSANYQTSAAEDVSNTQTLASLVAALNGNQTSIAVTRSNNDAATLQQQNAEVSQQNIEAIQEAGIINQTDQAFNINANNNQTSLAAFLAQLKEQGTIAQQTLGIAGNLAQQQETAFDSQIPYIVQHAGDQKNSGLDATNQTSIFQTILSGGNPNVAAAGTTASGAVAINGNNTGASITNSIIGSITKIGTSIAGGFFG